jgi:ATPase subunit of ABC transporter with duplicated ATPase domains
MKKVLSMVATSRIILNHLSFHLDQTPVRFNKLNLAFERLKYGIVGSNGVGKTTFLRLLTGELLPDSGTVVRDCHIITVPQSHFSIDSHASISDVLGVTLILQALKRLHQGSVDENDFEQIGDRWDIESRIQDALRQFNLWPINLQQLFHHLSGGQKTKILLAKTLISQADFIFFDEPTNNLDMDSRNILYRYVENSPKGMLIISHDRELLNRCDKILEITSTGIDLYGGNYDFYKKQKQIKYQALEKEIQARTDSLITSKRIIQTRMEKHQQNVSKGHKAKLKQISRKGSYDKLAFNAAKARSENTNHRIRLQADKKLESLSKNYPQRVLN